MKFLTLLILLLTLTIEHSFSQQDSIILIQIGQKNFLITNSSNLPYRDANDTIKNLESFGPNYKYKFVIVQKTNLTFKLTDTTGYFIIHKYWKNVDEENYVIDFRNLAKDLKSGIYCFKIVTDYESIKKKLVLLK